MFALWPLGRYGDILRQNHNILLKNRQILEKRNNHFIFTSILNASESSYDKCHKMSFLMSQTQFLCYIGHFGAKITDFLKRKSVKPVNISPLNHQYPLFAPRGNFKVTIF
jgi:hypothetical protein